MTGFHYTRWRHTVATPWWQFEQHWYRLLGMLAAHRVDGGRE